MSLVVLPAIVVAFAAVCIWLTMQIVGRRERRAKWTLAALLVGLPLLYVASFGPAIWLTGLDDPWAPHTAAIFWPLGRTAVAAPEVIRTPLVWYAGLFARPSAVFGDMPICCVPVGPGDKWCIAQSGRY